MLLIIGLGNPGPEYSETPHNIGFRVLDFFKAKNFPRQSWESRFSSHFLQSTLHGKEVILQKPLTFMNNSGVAVANCVKAYVIYPSEHLWLIHDELDLAWGRIKIDFAKSAAGHKGVQSVIDALETKNFWRFRIGVRPELYPTNKREVDKYLTDNPIPETRRSWDELVQQRVSELIENFIKDGIRKTDITYTLDTSL